MERGQKEGENKRRRERQWDKGREERGGARNARKVRGRGRKGPKGGPRKGWGRGEKIGREGGRGEEEEGEGGDSDRLAFVCTQEEPCM